MKHWTEWEVSLDGGGTIKMIELMNEYRDAWKLQKKIIKDMELDPRPTEPKEKKPRPLPKNCTFCGYNLREEHTHCKTAKDKITKERDNNGRE